MDSTLQLLNSPNLSNELINGQNGSGLNFSFFQKSDVSLHIKYISEEAT